MNKKKKITLAIVLAIVAALAAVPCLADTPAVSTTDIADIMSSVTGQFSVSNIVSFLAYIISATIALVFLWWAVRKAWRAIMAAATRGKARL